MREIKFRAWHREDKSWLEDWSISNYDKILDLNAELVGEGDNFILCQYSGVKDKNGKEIWEGDIVDWGKWSRNGERAVIEYYSGWGCFIFQFFSQLGGEGQGSMADIPYRKMTKECKVIGNIYENPELIEKA